MKAAHGSVFKYGDNVDTDVIIPARYLNSSDPKELATHCMEDIDKDFVKNVHVGDIIVANKNFGCGSSREHAPISIKASGVSCVIAETSAGKYRHRTKQTAPRYSFPENFLICRPDAPDLRLCYRQLPHQSHLCNYRQ